MAKHSPLTIFSILALLFVFWPFAESAESPFIVAHKRVALVKLNSDTERVSVSIDIYNRGSATAYDVTLTDDTWADNVFDSVIGNTSKYWERVDIGSIVSHSFELESKVKTVYYGAPAVVTYRTLTNARLQEAYSTPIRPLNILSETDGSKKLKMAKMLVMKYGSHLSVALISILFVCMLIMPSKSLSANGSRK